MIVYIAMLITTITFIYMAEKTSNKKGKFFLYFVAVIPFVIVSAFRYNVGTDYYFRYVPDYNSIANGNDVGNLEIGFKLLIKFCIAFTENPQILFIITSIVINLLTFYVVYRFSKNIIFSIIILFFNGFFFSSLNIVRQCLAISIIFVGYTFLIKEEKELKNNLLFVLFVVIAYLMHKSSIITASFLFFSKRNIMNWKWVMPFTIIVLILGEKLIYPFELILENTKYSVYFLDKFLESNVSIIYLIENTIVYILMNIKYYFDKKNGTVNKEEVLFLNIEGLGLIITALARCHVGFDRLALYCLSFQLLSIPFYVQKIKDEDVKEGKLREKQYMVMVAFIIIMFIGIFTKTNILNNNGEVVPYRTVFDKNFEIR